MSNLSRRGGALKALLVLIVVGVLGAMTWVTIATWRKDGEFSLHPLDPDWWTLSRPTPGSPQAIADSAKRGTESIADSAKHGTESVVDQAKRFGQETERRLWGQGGLVERVESWWTSRSATAPPPSTTTGAASADRGRLEQQLKGADEAFRAGLDAYKRASPSAGGSLADKQAAVAVAHADFSRTCDMLATSLPAYEALPDRDPAKAAGAHQLQSYAQQLTEMTAPR